MSEKKKIKNKSLELGIIVFLVLFSFVFWDTPIVYPIKLFVVLIHEINHAIMTIITGGSIKKILLAFNLSGLTVSSGGNAILIAASGYLGSLLLGALLYLSAFNIMLRKWTTTSLAVIILIVSVNLMQGGLQIFLGLTVSAFFYFTPKYLPNRFNSLFFQFIGLVSCLYVIADIKQDLLTTTLRETDSQILEYLTGIPAILIGFAFFIISIATVLLLLRKSYSS